MSELKAIQGVINGQQFDLYFKDEADKVIAELEKEIDELQGKVTNGTKQKYIMISSCPICGRKLSEDK